MFFVGIMIHNTRRLSLVGVFLFFGGKGKEEQIRWGTRRKPESERQPWS